MFFRKCISKRIKGNKNNDEGTGLHGIFSFRRQ